jgi:flagellar motor protein MotB
MIERRACCVAVVAAFGLCVCSACGPSAEQLRGEREREELRHEIVEVRQYNADLKFRMQLVEARNKILIDLVQGLTSDPEHFQPRQETGTNADAALQALDRDIEGLVASVRHSHSDLDALRAQRAALQAELAQARSLVEEARASQAGEDARVVVLRQLLAPMLKLVRSGHINVSMQYGQLTMQLPESRLFAQGQGQLTADGKVLLERVAEGLRSAPGRKFRIAGPEEGLSKRGALQRQLSAARSLAVVEFLTQCQVPGENLIATTHATAVPAGSDRNFEITLLPEYEARPHEKSPTELLEEAAPTAPELCPERLSPPL